MRPWPTKFLAEASRTRPTREIQAGHRSERLILQAESQRYDYTTRPHSPDCSAPSRNVLTQSSRAAFLLRCKHQLCQKHALQAVLNHPSECSSFTTCRCPRVPSSQHNNATTPTERSGSQHKRQSGTFHGRSEQFCPRNNSRGYRVSSAKRDCGRQWRKLDVVVSHHIDESHSGC